MHFFLSGHPRALWALLFTKMWDSLSYFGAQTILVLYLINHFHFSETNSYILYGIYAAFAYSTPILGGVVADKWIKNSHVLVVGAVLNIIGNLLLMASSYRMFCLGLATCLIGSGLYRSISTHLIGTLYLPEDRKKEAGFTGAYLAINFGGMIAPLLYGWLAYRFGWNLGFLCSAVGIAISLGCFLYTWPSSEKSEHSFLSAKTFSYLLFYMTAVLFCCFLSIPFYFPDTAYLFVGTIIGGGIMYLFYSIRVYKDQERNRLIGLLSTFLLAVFYFAVGLQIGSLITLFIQQQITKNSIPFVFPASVLSALYPFFVLLLAPFFNYFWNALSIKKIEVHLVDRLVLAIGFAIFGMIAFLFASVTPLILTGVIVGILFLSAGELVISPAIYVAISNLAPTGMKNTMMGAWLLCIALGGYLSSLLAKYSDHWMQPFFNKDIFVGKFLFIAGFTFLIFVGLMFISPSLKKLLR